MAGSSIGLSSCQIWATRSSSLRQPTFVCTRSEGTVLRAIVTVFEPDKHSPIRARELQPPTATASARRARVISRVVGLRAGWSSQHRRDVLE
jgi:hypothetical protein